MNRVSGFVLVFFLLFGVFLVNVRGNLLDFFDGDCVRGWVIERANVAEVVSFRCSSNLDRFVMGFEGER